MSYLCPICKLHHYSGDYPCESSFRKALRKETIVPPGEKTARELNEETLHPDQTLSFDEDGFNLLQAFTSAAIHIDVWKRTEAKLDYLGPAEIAQHQILENQNSPDPYQIMYAACLKTAFGQ